MDVATAKADELRNFRFRQVLGNSLDEMKDPILRESVREDLLKIYKAESSEKITSADRLIGLNVDHDDAAIIHKAIRKLSKQKETQNNAVLQITAAKIDLADIKSTQFQIQQKYARSEKFIPNVLDKLAVRQDADGLKPTTPKNTAELFLTDPGWTKAFEETKDLRNKISDYKLNLERTTRTAGGFDKITGTRLPNAKVNNKEAIWVNSQAARAYREIGDGEEADRREIMVRYYQANDKDRKNNMMFISRDKQDAMSSESSQKLELREMERNQPALKTRDFEEDPQKRQLSKELVVTNRRTNIVPDNSFQIEGSIKPLDNVQRETNVVHLDKNGNKVKKGLPYYREMPATITKIASPEELHPIGTGRAMRASGSAAALQAVNTWVPFLADIWYGKTAKAVARQSILERQVFRQENIPVPPKPEHLKSFRLKLEVEFGKAKASEAMQFIEEASHAYWKY